MEKPKAILMDLDGTVSKDLRKKQFLSLDSFSKPVFVVRWSGSE